MKRLYFIPVLLTVSAALWTGCAQAPESDQATVSEAAESAQALDGNLVQLDKQASTIEWVGTKVTGRHNGTLQINKGELLLKDNNLVGGSFTIDMHSLTTLDAMGAENGLTDHLKSDDFFSVDQFPTAEFVITSVQPLAEATADIEEVPEIDQYRVQNPSHEISGNLTIKGITRNVTFPASVRVSGTVLKAIAKFNIDRSEWDITYPGKPNDLISKTVHIGIGLQSAGQPG
jgi:polyisoprenoid-binding protein YceI